MVFGHLHWKTGRPKSLQNFAKFEHPLGSFHTWLRVCIVMCSIVADELAAELDVMEMEEGAAAEDIPDDAEITFTKHTGW